MDTRLLSSLSPPLDLLFLQVPSERAEVVSDTRHLLNTFNSAVQIHSDIFTTTPSSLPIDRDLFTVSQVCRYWQMIVVSPPLLWKRIDHRNLSRTIISLDCHRSVPLRLESNNNLSTDALDVVLSHGSKIASVSADLSLDQMYLLHSRLAAPSAKAR